MLVSVLPVNIAPTISCTSSVLSLVGAMFTGNTETNITATYEDSDGTIDLVSTDTQIGGATGVDFNDGVKARFGTGNDLEIFHDASDSYIKEAGVGELQIWSDTNLALRSDSFRLNNAANDENMIKADANGSVELYYDNVKTFATNTLGIIVYGDEGGTAQVDFAADESDDNADKWKVGCTDNGHFFISNKDSGAWDTNIECNRSGNVELYYDASKKIETISNGVKVHTNLYAEGTGQVSLNIGSTDAGGAAIFFDGDSNGDWSGNDYSSIVHNSDGNLVIKANSPGTANCYIQVGSDGDYAAHFNEGGSSLLRYDNSTKIETIATGINVTGGIRLGGNNTANELGDYEEGTFTVTNVSMSAVSDSYTGRYTKIGNQVFISISQTGGTVGFSAGNAIKGLPFTVSGSTVVSVTNRAGNINGNGYTYQDSGDGKIYVSFAASGQTSLEYSCQYVTTA